jgi:hypothetical protein
MDSIKKQFDNSATLYNHWMASSEYRKYSSRLERSVRLISDGKVRRRDVILSGEFSEKRIDLAIRAIKTHRDVGKRGRPTSLTDEESTVLHDLISIEAQYGTCMKATEIRKQVSFSSHH